VMVAWTPTLSHRFCNTSAQASSKAFPNVLSTGRQRYGCCS
jgi:hypothetical protein